MPIALSRPVKLDLPDVARFVEEHDGAQSAELLEALQERFGCKRRAAQDALTILVRGGWLERHADERDARRKHYVLTQQGRDDLRTVRGQREMRYARWHFSTTSTKARKRRAMQPDPIPVIPVFDPAQIGHNTQAGLTLRRPNQYTLKTFLEYR